MYSLGLLPQSARLRDSKKFGSVTKISIGISYLNVFCIKSFDHFFVVYLFSNAVAV